MTVLHTDDALHKYKHMHKRLKPEVDLAINYASPKKLDRDRKYMLALCENNMHRKY